MELELPTYDLEHSRPITGFGNFSYKIENSRNCQIDTTIADQKRALWDYVVKNNLLTSPDKLIRAKAQTLLRDKTIMLYAYFRLNGRPVKTYWNQDIVLSDKSKRVLFCACNQFLGKSTALDFDAGTEFLIDHGKRWVGLLVSGSLTQSQERMELIKLLLDSTGFKYKIKHIDIDSKGKSNATQLSYYFMDDEGKKPKYSNLLICCPHTSSALGYPANDIWLDEVDWWEDVRGGQIHFFNQVLDPRTYFTEGKIKGYSNPNGKDRMMYFLWRQKDKQGLPFWNRYHFNFWDKPNPTQERFDRSCVGKTKNEIESTLLAAFTTTEGSFFSTEEINDMLCPELSQKGDSAGYGKVVAGFLDVGSVHDQSVYTMGYIEPNPAVPDIPLIKAFWIHKYPVGYPIARVIGVTKPIIVDGIVIQEQVNPDDGWEDYAEDNPPIKQILDDYAEVIDETKYQPLFGFDATGSAGLLPLFQAAGIEAVDVTFTGKLKWHMYQRWQYYVQQRFFKRAKERDQNTVRGCDFNYQCSKLVIKKGTKTTYRQIHHENENDLDDCCFVAGTMILTKKGNRPIEDVQKGDFVLTRGGYKKVTAKFLRMAKVITRYGITATPNHPFITKSGTIMFKYLNESHVIYKWKGKQLGIMEGTITDTLNQNTDTSEDIIGLIGVTNHRSPYIGIYGKTRTDPSSLDISSTTGMETLLTTISQTLNLWKERFMQVCIPQRRRPKPELQELSLNMASLQQEHGMEQKKEKSGIKNIIKTLWLKLNQKLRYVLFVKTTSSQQCNMLNSAMSYVKVGEGNQEKVKKFGANIARLNSSQYSTSQNIVQKGVVQTNDGTRRVYNIEVEDEHEYFANNILVHNCDSAVGFIHLIENPDLPSLSFAIIGHKKIDSVEVGHQVEEIDKRLKGQYIPSFVNKKELGSWMDRRDELR